MSKTATMVIGRIYEVRDDAHPCNLWNGRLVSAAVYGNFCLLDFGNSISATFEFADPRLCLVEDPEGEAE